MTQPVATLQKVAMGCESITLGEARQGQAGQGLAGLGKGRKAKFIDINGQSRPTQKVTK